MQHNPVIDAPSSLQVMSMLETSRIKRGSMRIF